MPWSHSLPNVARVLAVACLAAVPSALHAQLVPVPPTQAPFDDGARAAYTALSLTPDGALAPMAGYLLSRPGEALEPVRLALRASGFERGPFLDQRAYAATLDIPLGFASAAITGGYVQFTCDGLSDENGDPEDCEGGWHVGARLGRSLWSSSLDAAATNVLVVGAEGTAGYADVTMFDVAVSGGETSAGYDALTATVGVPVGVRTRIGRVTVMPMVAPRVAFGRATLDIEGVSRDVGSAARLVLGAGVTVRLGRHLGLDAGLQRVQVDGAETTYGLGASVGF